MTTKEKQLFKALCCFETDTFDENLLEAATPLVLGQLFFNRMQAVAYGTLKKHNLLNKVNREFRNSLSAAYNQNIQKNRSFFQCVEILNEALADCACNYAMLKGALLCGYYPEAYRTSNDIDLLVSPNDITEIGRHLLRAGFKQGNIRNGKFEPASRKDIIESKMMRGETVPYIKEVRLPEMPFLEVDINFSLDYKPTDTNLVQTMLANTHTRKINELRLKTLADDDFFLHLCSHLYKEATTLPWIEMKRDMTLYKYCDIYMLLNDMSGEELYGLFSRAKELDMEKVCAFAIAQTSALFDLKGNYALTKAKSILKCDSNYIHRVISPKEAKFYIYKEKDIAKRFLATDRKKLLRRCSHYGST